MDSIFGAPWEALDRTHPVPADWGLKRGRTYCWRATTLDVDGQAYAWSSTGVFQVAPVRTASSDRVYLSG
jgi:hypothetical protein